MKKLLVYLNPQKKFEGENEKLIKIQIDSSLAFNWPKKDIELMTNFDYEYHGVKSKIIGLEGLHTAHIQATKFTTLAYLLKNNMLKDDIYWVLDNEAFQQEPITEAELGLDGYDMAVTTYGWSPHWCLGSFFIKPEAKDIILRIRELMDKHNTDDEKASRILISQNPDNVLTRIKTLNITYNFGMRHINVNWNQTDKPIKVVHFHPMHRRVNTLEIFLRGKNELGFPLVNEKLRSIFKHHGIK